MTPQDLFLSIYDRFAPSYEWDANCIQKLEVDDYVYEMECLYNRWAAVVRHRGEVVARVYCSAKIEGSRPDFREAINKLEQTYPTVLFFIWQVKPKQLEYVKLALAM